MSSKGSIEDSVNSAREFAVVIIPSLVQEFCFGILKIIAAKGTITEMLLWIKDEGNSQRQECRSNYGS